MALPCKLGDLFLQMKIKITKNPCVNSMLVISPLLFFQRAALSDYERFKVMKLKQTVSIVDKFCCLFLINVVSWCMSR